MIVSLRSPGGFLVITCAVMAWFLLPAKQNLDAEANYFAEMRVTEIEIPDNFPELNQDSIDLAIAMFQIETGSHVYDPKFDVDLKDRGLTSSVSFSPKSLVTIGPAAFENWSILGSTLAHEVEIHGNQSFFAIWIQDIVGFHGTENAEREAYSHEINQSSRFGLSEEDRSTISDTMEYYYPEKSNPFLELALSSKIKRWFLDDKKSSL